MTYTDNDGVEAAFPAELDDGTTVTIVKKEYEGQLMVLTDSEGNKYVNQPVGFTLIPYEDIEEPKSANDTAAGQVTSERVPDSSKVESGRADSGEQITPESYGPGNTAPLTEPSSTEKESAPAKKASAKK